MVALRKQKKKLLLTRKKLSTSTQVGPLHLSNVTVLRYFTRVYPFSATLYFQRETSHFSKKPNTPLHSLICCNFQKQMIMSDISDDISFMIYFRFTLQLDLCFLLNAALSKKRKLQLHSRRGCHTCTHLHFGLSAAKLCCNQVTVWFPLKPLRFLFT